MIEINGGEIITILGLIFTIIGVALTAYQIWGDPNPNVPGDRIIEVQVTANPGGSVTFRDFQGNETIIQAGDSAIFRYRMTIPAIP